VKVYVVALLLVVGILGGFYGGYKLGQNNVSASTGTPNQSARTGTNGGGFNGARGIAAACPSPGAPSPSPGGQAVARGTVTNLASSSLTITNTSCDIKVSFGSTVTINKQVAGSTSDLKNNLTITITGTRQADGSILAQTIQIGGAGGAFAGNQPGGAAPAAGG
jgi:hypothetical protein